MSKIVHFKDITGHKFNKLTEMWPVGYDGNRRIVFHLCLCDCGNITVVRQPNLISGVTKSCGCWKKEQNSKVHKIHGCSRTTEHNAYCGAKYRCTNPNYKEYDDYGGRGIEFRFNSFEEFLGEVGFRPSSDYSLDRTNNDGHYEKGNVKWSTKQEQIDNRRIKRLVNFTNEEIIKEYNRRGLNGNS